MTDQPTGRGLFAKNGGNDFVFDTAVIDTFATSPTAIPYAKEHVEIPLGRLLNSGVPPLRKPLSGTVPRDATGAMLRLLASVASRDTGGFFYYPEVDRQPNYLSFIPNPLDLSTIGSRVCAGFYCFKARGVLHEQFKMFEDDVVEMVTNACCYHLPGSVLYTDALRLLKELPSAFVFAGIRPMRLFLQPEIAQTTAKEPQDLPAVEVRRDADSASMVVAREALMLMVLERIVCRDVLRLLQKQPAQLLPTHPVALKDITNRIVNHRYHNFCAFQGDVDLLYCGLMATLTGAQKLGAAGLRNELYKQCAITIIEFVNRYPATKDPLLPCVTSVTCTDIQVDSDAKFVQGLRKREHPWQEEESAASGGIPDGDRAKMLATMCEWQAKDTKELFTHPWLEVSYVGMVGQPMDISTIKYKLIKGLYTDIQQVLTDGEQIVDNCILFNGPDHEMSRLVCELRAHLPKLLKKHGLVS